VQQVQHPIPMATKARQIVFFGEMDQQKFPIVRVQRVRVLSRIVCSEVVVEQSASLDSLVYPGEEQRGARIRRQIKSKIVKTVKVQGTSAQWHF